MNEGGMENRRFESGPKNFTAILADKTDFRKEVREGNNLLAICVDMSRGTIYFGNNHNAILRYNPIPAEHYFKGIVAMDDQDNAELIYLWDMSGLQSRNVEEPELKRKILDTIKRDIIEKRG